MPSARTRLSLVLVAFASATALAGPAAVQVPRLRVPVKFTALSKDQLVSLADDAPIEINGKVTTKAALLAPLKNARAEADAELRMKLAQAGPHLQALKVRSAALHRQQIDRSKSLVSAAIAQIRIVPTPGPKPTPCATPVVAGVIGLVTPDSDVLVLGHCFGTQQGSAALQGNFGSVALIVREWHDSGIGLHVPSTLAGAADQYGIEGAQIVVTTATNQSPAVPPRVDFKAARDHRVLEAYEVKTDCSPGADINNCDPTAGRTLDASHSNTVDVTSDHGSDVVSGKLKNGWVVVDQQITMVSKGNFFSPCEVFHDPIPSSPTGNFSLHYGFNVSPFQYCRTMVLLYAEGPLGTSPR